MNALVAIFLVVLLFRIALRGRRVIPPAVQVIVVQPGAAQAPTLPAAPAAPAAQSHHYSQPFNPGFLGLNRQN